MISGGNTTVYVSNMDAAVQFYTERLGLKLTNRFGNQWATVSGGPSYWTTDEVGAGLVIGLHPQSPRHPAPGTTGAVMFGLETYDPIAGVIADLGSRGVRVSGDVISAEGGNFVTLEDPDGNPIYLWEIAPDLVPETDLGGDHQQEPQSAASPLSGGHAIVYVSDLDASIRFYTDVLGLRLTCRFDDKLATVEAGSSLVIVLHPASLMYPPPGTKGATMIGLGIDEPIDRVVSRLAKRGVRILGDTSLTAEGRFAEIADVDGNAIYLWAGNHAERSRETTGAVGARH